MFLRKDKLCKGDIYQKIRSFILLYYTYAMHDKILNFSNCNNSMQKL